MGVHSNRLEGSTKLTKAVRAIGYNKGLGVRLGTVKTAPPSLEINADDIGFTLEAEDVVVAEGALPLTAGDRVILLDDEDGGYYVIDKVGDV